MYTKIINPDTNRKVSIHTKLGKNIINNYMNTTRIMLGGSNNEPTNLSQELEEKIKNELSPYHFVDSVVIQS